MPIKCWRRGIVFVGSGYIIVASRVRSLDSSSFIPSIRRLAYIQNSHYCLVKIYSSASSTLLPVVPKELVVQRCRVFSSSRRRESNCSVCRWKPLPRRTDVLPSISKKSCQRLLNEIPLKKYFNSLHTFFVCFTRHSSHKARSK